MIAFVLRVAVSLLDLEWGLLGPLGIVRVEFKGD